MGVLAQQGIAVPADVSVIGWDDSEAAALSLVGLTSVVQQPAELARLAVERVVDRINRRRVEEREIVLEPGLQVATAPHRHDLNVLTMLCGGAVPFCAQVLDRSSDVSHSFRPVPNAGRGASAARG